MSTSTTSERTTGSTGDTRRRAVAHVGRLARIDVQRMRRKHTDWGNGASSVVSVLLFLVLLGITTFGGGYLAYRAGQELASGGAAGVTGGEFTLVWALRGILAVFWIVVTVIFVVRAVGQRGTLAQPEGILTVVPTVEALCGTMLAEFVFLLHWALVPAVAVAVGLAVGTGTVLPLVTVPLGVACVGLASVVVGYPVGVGIRHVVTRFPFVARNKGVVVVVVFVGYFVLLATGAVDRLLVSLFEPMQATPIAWYADLMALGLPALSADPLRAGGALATTVALTVLGVAGGTRVVDRHWFSDPALAGVEKPATDEGDAAAGVERRLEPLVGVAPASLVAVAWRRAVRSPMKLLYAFYPLLFMAGVFADIVQSGRVPVYLPYAVVLFVAWAAGVVFTLNPLGEQGSVLAGTLLSRVDGREFVRSNLLASLLVAVPASVVLTAAVGVLSPLAPERVALLVVAAPVVVVVSATLSVGIGMAFPRFEATNVTRSMKTVLPSRWAFVLFSAHLFATAAAGGLVAESTVRTVAATLLSWLLPFGLSVSADGLYWVAVVALVPLVLAPIPAYRYAVRRFDRYTIA